MEIERLDYGDVIRTISEQYNIDLTDFQSKRESSKEYASEKEKAKRIMLLAQRYFVQAFNRLRDTDAAIYDYVHTTRWLDTELIKKLWIGYAPWASQEMFSFFQQEWYSVEDLIGVWLAKSGEHSVYAFFRDRLMIPIRDQFGSTIGFGARALQDWQEPKYLNSSDSVLYDKSQALYGIDQLKRGVRDHQAIIVVEWYFDVIALERAGLALGVATCGTSLTAWHVKTLQRYSDRVYFLFDADSAWQQATLRGLRVAYKEWVYPQIISLTTSNHPSDIKDIDEFVSTSNNPSQDVEDLLTWAQDGFAWALDRYIHEFDEHTPVGRQKIMQGLFDLVYETSTVTSQNLFLEQIAERLRIDYALVLSQYRRYVKTDKKVFRARSRDSSDASRALERQEQREYILGALLYEEFWTSLKIDEAWITSLKELLATLEYHIDSDRSAEYTQRQLWRENEYNDLREEDIMPQVKKILLSSLHRLQQARFKTLSDEDKKKSLELMQSLK